MRFGIGAVVGLVGLTLASGTKAQSTPAAPARHGIVADLKTYPQGTPKQALASVLGAIDAKRFDYLTAQLADPVFIDERVKRVFDGKFQGQVEDVRARLAPFAVKQLRRFLKDGSWEVEKADATVRLEEVRERCVRLVRRDDRWFLAHPSGLPKKAPAKE